jgi:replicative DNA helicase
LGDRSGTVSTQFNTLIDVEKPLDVRMSKGLPPPELHAVHRPRRISHRHDHDASHSEGMEEARRCAAGENRTQQVSHVSRCLKNLARELGAPIIALSQLSRSTEQRNPPIPILSDLRDSGGIEQDADVVLMLYREELHNEDYEHPGETDVFVRKNRNGPTGRVGVFFDSAKMSFHDLVRLRQRKPYITTVIGPWTH